MTNKLNILLPVIILLGIGGIGVIYKYNSSSREVARDFDEFEREGGSRRRKIHKNRKTKKH